MRGFGLEHLDANPEPSRLSAITKKKKKQMPTTKKNVSQ